MKKETISYVAYILILVGAINWGLIGLFGLDIVTTIFGALIARIIYVIVGLAAVYKIFVDFSKK
jgi:uncharacterized protein